jgi:gamma-glutamyl:cysteine ligase YbdK (ATP-grasp superfamily)
MNDESPIHLFEAFGVEIEYMIVDAETLNVRPITDRVLAAIAGEITSDVEIGAITWSNELAAHVIELKTTEPARSLAPLPAEFNESVRRINSVLEPLGGRLMPSAMHPWMDPNREMVLWAHDFSFVYEAFNRIFDCRGHGWANLQAVHLNLPFAEDAEFARLHAAIRVVLPILPALAASSPIVDGRPSGLLDTRLDVYRHNARRIPLAAGRVIPEPVFSAADYRRQILEPLYAEIAPHDPEGILQEEWLNSRGAIARFERNTIEVRVLDVQECPQADVAICALVADVLEGLAGGRWGDPILLQEWDTEPLAELLMAMVRDADQTVIRDTDYLRLFGVDGRGPLAAADLWRHLAQAVGKSGRSADPSVRPAVETILERGPLARRILAAAGSAPTRDRISTVYRELCECLAAGRMFVGLD